MYCIVLSAASATLLSYRYGSLTAALLLAILTVVTHNNKGQSLSVFFIIVS